MKIIAVTAASLSICTCVFAGELHPIVEVKTGYFFGATSEGKWIKAGAAAKALNPKTKYRVYDLTSPLGEITGNRPTAAEDVCPDNF